VFVAANQKSKLQMAQIAGGGWWPRFEQRVFGRYLGVQGGVILRGERWQRLAQRSPMFARCNNGLFDLIWFCLFFFFFASFIPLSPPFCFLFGYVTS
jgi:hypothetical protein